MSSLITDSTQVNVVVAESTTINVALTSSSGGNTDANAIHDNVASEISAITEKTNPVDADLLLIEDSEASNAKKKVQIGSLDANDSDAIHDNVAGEITAVSLKASPNNSDVILIEDSEDSSNKKRITIGTLPTGTGMSSFDAAADSGANQTITNGETLTIAGGTGIDTSVPVAGTISAALDSITQSAIAANTAKVSCTTANVDAAGAVMNTGDETIAGVKTFSSFPVTPSSAPTTDYQAANKKYVDDNAAGEANTASNVGVGGVGVFKQKATYDLEFKNINAGSNKITVTDDPTNSEVDIDIAEANISHNSIGSQQGGTTNEYYHLTSAQHTDLTDSGDSTSHYHATDRARANHTGTQTASTISDFDTSVTTNVSVNANTTHRVGDGSDHTFINQSVTTTAGPTFDEMNLTPKAAPSHSEALIYYDSTYKCFVALNDISDVAMNIGEELWIRVYNDTGSQIDNGKVCYLSGISGTTPTVALAQANSSTTCLSTIGFATNNIANGAYGYITKSGTVRGLDTSGCGAGNILYLSATVAGDYSTTSPTSPNYKIILGNCGIVNASTGTIEANVFIGNNIEGTINIYNGGILEDHTTTVTSNGSTITLTLEKSGGGDLSLFFDGEFRNFDCTPAASVELTAGTDTSPQINYAYILESNDTLTVSTSSFPSSGQFVPVATVLCQSAASLQTDGPLKWHAWTDHLYDDQLMGHLFHLNKWVRNQNATWLSGGAVTPTAGVATFDVAVASGSMLQMHEHPTDAFNTATGSDIYVVNNNSTPYVKVGDLTGQLADSEGGSLSSRSYSLVIWMSGNEGSGQDKLYCNLPSGSYAGATLAVQDASKYSNYTIPASFKGTGILLARLTVSHSPSGGGTWTLEENEDLRGQVPQSGAGGSTSFPTEFSDNTFRIVDDGDNTKEIAFQVSGVTTGTTRTLTLQDKDITIADAADLTAHTDDSTIHFTQAAISITESQISDLSHDDTDAIHDNEAGEINAITEKGTPASGDWLLIEDSADSNNKKKVQVGNLPTGGGGEANTASSQGSGTSVYYQKSGIDLQFNGIKSENNILDVSLDAVSHDVELTVQQANITGVGTLTSGTWNATAIADGYLASGATVTSAGAGDSGKLIKLDAAGHVDATCINDADIDHNTTGSKQGGTTDEYYHLTSAQHTVATQAATSSVNGYATSTQITKLDGIEALADVTDATNVAAAGAVMDSDITGNGVMIRTGAGSYTNRSIASGNTAITISNADGTAGNPTATFNSGNVKLDDLGSPDDNTDLDVSTSAHGLCPKAPNDANQYLDGTGSWAELPTSEGSALTDLDTDATASTSVAKWGFYLPYAMTLTEVYASAGTAPTGSAMIIDVHYNGTTVFTSTKCQIAASSNTGTQSTLSTTALAKGGHIEFFIDQIGSTVAGKRVTAHIIGTRT